MSLTGRNMNESTQNNRALIQYEDAIFSGVGYVFCGDTTAVRSSYIHNAISYTGMTASLY